MIDTTKSVTVTKTGLNVLKQGDHPGELFTFGKILLLRKNHCIVLVSAGPLAGHKVNLELTFPCKQGDGTIYHVDIPDDSPAVVAAVKIRTPRVPGETKIGRCRALYDELHLTVSREQMIERFVQIGCTPAGAVTYYLTCKKG
jgi:hypothetical protein